MLDAIRAAHPGLVLDSLLATNSSSAPTSPTDAMSPVPSLSRSILSASDSSPNGWVTLELPQTTSPSHSPTPSNTKSDQDDCPAHVRFHDTCLIIPDTPIKSPGLAARMLGVGAWSTKRRVSDPDREQSAPLLGVRLPGLGRRMKHIPCEAPPCAPAVLRPCLVHRSNSQHAGNMSSSTSASVPIVMSRPRLSAAHSTPHAHPSSLPSVLVRAPTRSNSLPPPSSFTTIPLRECCPDCVSRCTQLEGAVMWSAGAKKKRREDRAEREREAKAGLRDTSANSAFGWEDMLAFEASDADASEAEAEAGPSSSAYQRRNASPPPSSLATRRCGASAAQALKHPHALPCPLPRVCTEDDTDEEGLFPLPISPRSIRSPCSRSPGKRSPKGTGSSNTPSPTASDEIKCSETKDPKKCAEVIAVKCAEKAKIEVVGPAVRRLLEVQQASYQGHRLSPVPGSEEPTPRSGTPTLLSERKEEERERGRKLQVALALADELPAGQPPVTGSWTGGRPAVRQRRSSSASSVGRTLGALVRGVVAGAGGGQRM
ncbi:hypothetical protein BDV93DRAFT_172845 [Ceratobasidium sp. AG-I]|nr:hypothetical protein BDV93DRAFT_172845 [Ceratobasidium sp. AG-I]